MPRRPHRDKDTFGDARTAIGVADDPAHHVVDGDKVRTDGLLAILEGTCGGGIDLHAFMKPSHTALPDIAVRLALARPSCRRYHWQERRKKREGLTRPHLGGVGGTIVWVGFVVASRLPGFRIAALSWNYCVLFMFWPC